MPKKFDLTSKRFGKVVVIRQLQERSRCGDKLVWECMCDCGNVVVAPTGGLNRGGYQSCGCLNTTNHIENSEKMHLILKEKEWIEDTNLSKLNTRKPKNNTSGIKGVYWAPRQGKWFAKIVFQKIHHHLGYFDRLEDAAKARKEAEEKYFTPILEKYGRLEESK